MNSDGLCTYILCLCATRDPVRWSVLFDAHVLAAVLVSRQIYLEHKLLVLPNRCLQPLQLWHPLCG